MIKKLKQTKIKKSWNRKIWSEGKYLDFWSLNHTLGGAVLAGTAVFIGFSFGISFLVSFLIMITWEVYEFYGGIEEKTSNKILDVVTGLVGFLITYHLMYFQIFNNLILFLVIFFAFFILEIWGYVFYRKFKQ